MLLHCHGLVLALQLRLHHDDTGLKDAAGLHRRLLQRHLAALDAGELQHVVNDGEHFLAADLNVLQVALQPLRLLPVLLRQIGIADDGVHGGADIVGHIEEEGTLSLIRGIGGYHGVLQKYLLLGLRHPLPPQVQVDAHAQQHCHHTAGQSHTYGGLTTSLQKLIGGVHADLHAQSTHDLTIFILHRVAGRENGAPRGIHYITRIHGLSGQRRLEIGNHLLLDAGAGIGKVLRPQIQTVDEVDRLPVLPQLGGVEIPGGVQGPQLIEGLLQFQIARRGHVAPDGGVIKILPCELVGRQPVDGVGAGGITGQHRLQHIAAEILVQHMGIH